MAGGWRRLSDSTRPDKDAKEKFAWFRRLSDKTENGDEEAYRELHKAVCDSFTGIVHEASDIGRRAQ
jgi:hypothetical protein